MKNELRKNLKNICKNEYSESLTKLLRECKEYKNAKNIMIFYPLKNEISLLSLLEDEDKNFYLPRIEGSNLYCCPYKKGDALKLSEFNTKEPISSPVDKNQIELVVVPALCCDKNNYRLGYGKGFYDRFLKDFQGKKVVCLPSSLILDTVYPEEHDVPVDIVITC